MTDWIEWSGGECPVENGVLVEVRFCAGDAEIGVASRYRWNWEFGGEGGDIIAYRLVDAPRVTTGALASQVAGTHYKECKIQPVEFSEANKLQYLEGSIVARAARHDKATGKGAEDIRKIIHEAQLLLQLRYGEAA